MSDLHEKLDQARESARKVCGEEGATSAECAVEWDTVEEISAEIAHQKQKTPPKSSLEQYCDDNPDALECRVYDD